MVALARPASAFALFACLPLAGCLVSFHDYPLGAGGMDGASAAGGSDAGGTLTIGSSAGDQGAGGGVAGDSSSGGSTTIAGSTSGGAPAGGSAAGGAPAGGSDSGGGAAAGGAAAGGAAAGGAAAGGAAAGTGGDTAGSTQGGTGGVVMPPADLLIDDFEDGDSQISLLGGRNGSWFAQNDGTYRGVQTPDPKMATLPSALVPARGASKRAMHTTGSGFTTWGAVIGANFLMGTTPGPYDISAHQGLTFVAKLGTPMSTKQVRVSIRDYDTLYGCTGTGCGDHFGTSVTLTEAFQTITIPFSSLKQVGWGRPQVPAFDPTRTYAVTFAWTQYQNFDVWIDDLSFY